MYEIRKESHMFDRKSRLAAKANVSISLCSHCDSVRLLFGDAHTQPNFDGLSGF